MMEGRVVLPLPPEMEWDAATPVVLPGAERRAAEVRILEAKLDEAKDAERATKRGIRKVTPKAGKVLSPVRTSRAVGGYGFGAGSGFGVPSQQQTEQKQAIITEAAAEVERMKADKEAAKQALKAAQRKNDPELVAYARELRDRWQEYVCATPLALADKQRGRYAVGRRLEGADEVEWVEEPVKRLAA